MFALIGAVAVLQACGGGGSSSGGSDNPPQGGVTGGVAVDPYLVGAVFQEVTPAAVVVQESSPSGVNGAFSFPKPLTAGNLVMSVVGGQHNGVPYNVTLKRRVDVSSGTIVASPLTTLVADNTLTPAQVVGMLNSATGGALTVDDLFADPMARLLDGDVSASDRYLLASSIASSVALQVLGGNVGSADLDDVVAAVAPKLVTVLASAGSPQAVASAAAAVADYVARNADSAQEAQSLAAQVQPALITLLVQAAAGGQNATIVESGGTLVAGTSAGTVADHLAKGMDALDAAVSSGATDKFLEAANRFAAAAALVNVDETATTNDRDRARFFGAVARLGVLAQPYSDGNADGLQDLGDILDGFGLGGTAAQRSSLETFDMETCVTHSETYYPGYTYTWQECEAKPFSNDSPRSGELQAFFSNQVGSALKAAVSLLDGVSATFTAQVRHSDQIVEIDYTDALVIKAMAQALLADLNVQAAYDLDVDLDKLRRDTEADGYEVETFLSEYPMFMKLKDSATVAATLPAARQYARGAVASLQLALASLEGEVDGQANDLIRFSRETCSYSGYQYTCTQHYNEPAQTAEIESVLAQIDSVLAANGAYTLTMETPDASDDITVDVDKLFAGIDLRAKFPSVYTAGAFHDRPGMFPDPTFGGFLVSGALRPNEDLDGDGSPDLFGGYTYFFEDYLLGTYSLSWPFVAEANTWVADRFTFQAGNRFDWVRTVNSNSYPPVPPVTITYAGTYSTQANVLTLTFDSVGPNGVATVVVTSADELEDGGYWFGGNAVFKDALGTLLVPSWPGMHWYRYYYY